MDGISSSATPGSSVGAGAEASQAKAGRRILLAIGSVLYLIFVFWSFLLMSVFPTIDGSKRGMEMLGFASMMVAALLFLGVGGLGLLHISRSKAPLSLRKFALIKICAIALPGLLLSAATLAMMLREPPLIIDITDPKVPDQWVAPVAITFSLQTSINNLAQRGFRPIQFKWDINGDGKIDQTTLNSSLTVTFDREGVYLVSVQMVSADGSSKLAVKRFVIQQAVISVIPNPPLVERPVVLSLSHLFPDKNQVLGVQWDLDNDGKVDEDGKDLQISHTFFQTGEHLVTASVSLLNKTQLKYQRNVIVQDPPPLPFPVRIVTDPAYPIGTAPFTALFKIESEEKISAAQWSFGDGEREEGLRVAHTFTQNGSFPVLAKIRSESGVIVDLSTVVDIVETLSLSDLSFEGSPRVSGNRIQGEVPLTVNITPVTRTPFVQFFWEVPDATEVGSTEETLQAIYRREGSYSVTLIARDAEDRVMRMPITIDVQPPKSVLTIQMSPETGVAPLHVQFDASESYIPGEDITGFIWGFGDSAERQFGGARTEHTYLNPNTYVVDLTVRTTSGKQFSTTRTIVVRAAPIQACILPSRLRGTTPLAVEFSSSCSTGNIRRLLWDFGDGSQTDEIQPIHVFQRPGVYDVSLTITDGAGASSVTKVSITAQ